jgi:hypothetical protein
MWKLTVMTNNGYSTQLTGTARQTNHFECGNAFEHSITGTEEEACFTDNYSDCGSYQACQLCDFKSRC